MQYPELDFGLQNFCDTDIAGEIISACKIAENTRFHFNVDFFLKKIFLGTAPRPPYWGGATSVRRPSPDPTSRRGASRLPRHRQEAGANTSGSAIDSYRAGVSVLLTFLFHINVHNVFVISTHKRVRQRK